MKRCVVILFALLIAPGTAHADGLLFGQGSNDAMARALDHGAWDGLSDLGNAYGDGILFGGLALGAEASAHFSGDASQRAFARDLERSLALTWGTVWVLKLSVDERRPDGGDHSFPSGHTATAFAGATVLARHGGWRLGVPAYALAVGTGMERIEDRRHFLGDVLVGAGLGYGLARLAMRRRDGPFDLLVAPDRLGINLRF